jgi:hypothetical protein
MKKLLATFGIFGLLIIGLTAKVLYADQVKQYNIVKSDPKIHVLEKCGDYGNCFSIDLNAPGNITAIQYSCEGSACGWTHPCPDGSKCNQRANEYELNGNTAVWYGWSSSGDPHAVYKFRISYQ